MSPSAAAAPPSPTRIDACVGTADGSVVLVRQPFAASEGHMGESASVRIALLTGGGGPLYQRTALGRIESPWPVGSFTVALPGCAGEYRSPALHMLGLEVGLAHLQADGHGRALDTLHAVAARLHADPVVSAVLHAMWQCAAVHAGSRAFFEHGVAVILQRLRDVDGPAPPQCRPPAALSRRQLARVEAFIDAHLGEDIGVARMAREAGQDSSRFSRSFRQCTGMTPYAYLTWRRMQVAKPMLLDGRAVTEVALAMGYANPGKFAAAFRRVVGQGPQAWARGHAGMEASAGILAR